MVFAGASSVAALVVGVVVFRMHGSWGLMAGCPPGGDFVDLVLSNATVYESSRSIEAEYAVFSARSGSLVERMAVGDTSDDARRAFCAAATPDRHWLVDFDRRIAQVDARRAAIAVPAATVAARARLIGETTSVGWDDERGQIVANTSQGFAVAIDPVSLSGTRVAGTPSLSTLSGMHDDVVPFGVVRYYVGGLATLRGADGVRWRLDGHPRSRVIREGQPLFAGRDFLSPAFLVHPGNGSVEWSDPPSVFVVEETAVGSITYRITRIRLDGTVMWTFTPEESTPAHWMYRPVPYAAYVGGQQIVLFEAGRLVGLDAATGSVRYRTEYGAQP